MISVEQRLAIYDLYAEYAAAIDDARFADWLDLFGSECSYRIVPRDNFVANLPLALVLCENKKMLIDRIMALEEANEYAIKVDRHTITGIRITNKDGYKVSSEASFVVYQSDNEGVCSLYVVGQYKDTVDLSDGIARFISKTAIVDNFCIPHAIATPI